ncbi:hypothetical protein [Aneurinibacillus aneurinilyticus]|uniref:Uncharacterized protein n=1 Tax=Aneurinibacillus aneurinilyticus ATCC 12856 TaxID=649747 RepID=U1YFM3_ANEAE|nr:hypothetical protein [Aneurinibacillus aneurinilyticus]ERI10882.1 hypothetical protein HMPREF0083_00994 [Aneurinibacillus aneurinilyticus ATCC 12856]MED0704959.1 hypothetical protein [Aneurinibacillus aneurinilyticus]MED0723099.1 hypothetical protein [Aneurinibacillus aneurinilyticus]MED0731480.1 hypothetical protein [Aneurinibacillus aneurinilyticus]MED0740103.1 hypothetical protein [Aneurinibacillus aneurinilyticus]
MFTKESIVVKTWVLAVQNGVKSFEDVPVLHNLRDCVSTILEEGEDNV